MCFTLRNFLQVHVLRPVLLAVTFLTIGMHSAFAGECRSVFHLSPKSDLVPSGTATRSRSPNLLLEPLLFWPFGKKVETPERLSRQAFEVVDTALWRGLATIPEITRKNRFEGWFDSHHISINGAMRFPRYVIDVHVVDKDMLNGNERSSGIVVLRAFASFDPSTEKLTIQRDFEFLRQYVLQGAFHAEGVSFLDPVSPYYVHPNRSDQARKDRSGAVVTSVGGQADRSTGMVLSTEASAARIRAWRDLLLAATHVDQKIPIWDEIYRTAGRLIYQHRNSEFLHLLSQFNLSPNPVRVWSSRQQEFATVGRHFLTDAILSKNYELYRLLMGHTHSPNFQLTSQPQINRWSVTLSRAVADDSVFYADILAIPSADREKYDPVKANYFRLHPLALEELKKQQTAAPDIFAVTAVLKGLFPSGGDISVREVARDGSRQARALVAVHKAEDFFFIRDSSNFDSTDWFSIELRKTDPQTRNDEMVSRARPIGAREVNWINELEVGENFIRILAEYEPRAILNRRKPFRYSELLLRHNGIGELTKVEIRSGHDKLFKRFWKKGVFELPRQTVLSSGVRLVGVDADDAYANFESAHELFQRNGTD